MLTLTESEARRNAGEKKRAKGKKRTKLDKGQKKALLTIEKEMEEREELQIHELMPVPYKPEDHEAALSTAEVTFEQATVTAQDCQPVSISCMDAVPNSNKFVIITLLEPEAQGITGEELLGAEELTGEADKGKHAKLQKKVILLHKIDPQAAAAAVAATTTTAVAAATTSSTAAAATNINNINILPAIEATTSAANVADAAAAVGLVKEEKNEFDAGPLVTIDFSDYASATTDNKDLANWIKQFHTLALQYTESGKPYVKCPACTALFFKASSFEKHVSCHLRKQDELYVCIFCKYNNADASTIFDHLNIHQDQCEICNVNLTRKNYFKKHWEISESIMTFRMKRDRWGRFICIYCKLGFDLLHQLQKHWFKHSCNSKKTSQCNNCSGLFDTDEALQNHVCLKCPVCGKICDSVHRLRSHTRYEKHYLYCQICSYEFILAVDHEKHMALHKKIYHTTKDYAHCLESEDRTSFQCGICGKIYHTMSMLVLHIHDDHKIPDDSRALTEEELARISLPEVKDGASYDIIAKCEVDFERACEEVLDAQTDRTSKKPDESGSTEGNDQCEPVALCWNRYSIEDQSTIRKTT